MKRRIYSFEELDSTEEVVDAINRLENNLANEVEALQEEVERLNDKLTKKKTKKKGFVMNKTLIGICAVSIILGLMVTFASGAYTKSDISYDIVSNPDTLTQFLLDVVGTTPTYTFTPGSAPGSNVITEGMVYYDDTANKLYVSTNGTTWTALETGSGNSLSAAYTQGSKILAPTLAVEIEVADGSNNGALLIDSDDTTDAIDVVAITNAGDDAAAVSIQIDGTAGYDIQGTGDVWNVTYAGVATLVGLVTSTGDVTLTGSNYNIIHDASADQLEFTDGAKISFGDDDDMTIAYDGSGNDLDILGSGLEIAIGADDEGIDVIWHTEATGDAITFDESAADVDIVDVDIDLDDDAKLRFGSTDDITFAYDASGDDLNITGAGLEVCFGVTDDGMDVVMWGATASQRAWWDTSADTFYFGDDAEGVDVYMNADTTGDYAMWDESDEQLELVGATLTIDDGSLALGDGDAILLGDTLGTGDFTISDATDVLTIDNVVDGTGTVSLGTSGAGIDVTFHGDAGSATMLWDEDQNTNGALVFNNADVEMGDGDFIQLGDGADHHDHDYRNFGRRQRSGDCRYRQRRVKGDVRRYRRNSRSGYHHKLRNRRRGHSL
jgi:hypothetical protein